MYAFSNGLLTGKQWERDCVECIRPRIGRADVSDVDLHPDLALKHVLRRGRRRGPLVLQPEGQRRRHAVLQILNLEIDERFFSFRALRKSKKCTKFFFLGLVLKDACYVYSRRGKRGWDPLLSAKAPSLWRWWCTSRPCPWTWGCRTTTASSIRGWIPESGSPLPRALRYHK